MENASVPNAPETEVLHRDLEERRFKETIKWQNKILPWLVIMPTVLMLAFVVLATQQLMHFNRALETKPDSTLVGEIIPLPQGSTTPSDKDYIKWVTLTKLEQESFYRRYNQAGLLLMSRIYTKYLGFFTGMILAIVGSVFIIGKISEQTTTMEGTISEKIKFNVVSSSPGIIFGLLGTVLMLSTILKHNDITVQDTPLYLNAAAIHFVAIPSAKDSSKIDATEAENLWEQKANK
jgi:hypothetical protein